jgi:AraC family transcriptional regulator, regulatory protein of adaptative response / methylated-DNA-[protein]-cysteine methyltransferase
MARSKIGTKHADVKRGGGRNFRVAAQGLPVYSFFMTDETGWSRDYARIEQAISFIERNRERRPGLAEIAKAAGLSEFHFQRLFTRMVGISPKKYEQYLTKEAAKVLLDESENLLESSFDVGLSGPGRLHDLFVTCEAVTPGEYKSRGRGLAIRYGFHPTPFGEAMLALTDRGICALYFAAEGERNAVLQRLREEWSNASCAADQRATGPVVQRIFEPVSSAQGPLTLYLRGTNFQVKVWEALLSVPAGRLTTYERIAEKIGRPSATRAVGSAVGRNPVAFVIPCHRVIRKTGDLGGYHWGIERKRLILAWESERAVAAAG